MFKLRFAFLFVVLFVCTCCASPLAEEPEIKSPTERKDKNSAEEERVDEASDEGDGDGFAEYQNDNDDNDDADEDETAGDQDSEREQGDIQVEQLKNSEVSDEKG